MNKNTVISAENGLHQHHNINNHRHEEHSNTNLRFNVKQSRKNINYFQKSASHVTNAIKHFEPAHKLRDTKYQTMKTPVHEDTVPVPPTTTTSGQ